MNRFEKLRLIAAAIGLCLLSGQDLLAQTAPATLPDLKLSTVGYIIAMTRQDDGKMIIGGIFSSVNGIRRTNLARLNLDGSLDATWNPQPNGTVSALALNGDDLYVGGDFTSIGGEKRFGLARVSILDGRTDANWNPSTNSGSGIKAILVSGTNVYVGGNFTGIGAYARTNVARLSTASPGLADSWNPGANSDVYVFALEGTNLYAGGIFTRIGGQDRNRVARLHTQGVGVVDPWNPNVQAAETNVNSYYYIRGIIASASSVFICGNFYTIGSSSQWGVAKVSALSSGALDLAWNPIVNSYVDSMAIKGTNLFIGTLYGFLRLPNSGSVNGNPGWNGNNSAFPSVNLYSSCNVLLANSDDTALYAGGSFGLVNGDLALGVAKIDQISGARDASYDVQVEKPSQYIYAVARQPDGKMIVAGDFWRADGLTRRHVARVSTDGTLDSSWAPVLDGNRVEALAVDGTNIFIGGDFLNVGGRPRFGLAKLSTTSDAADPQWNPLPSDNFEITSLAVSGTNLFFAGDLYPIYGAGPAKTSTLGAGVVDTNWAPNTQGSIFAMAVSGTNLFIGGNFSSVGGQALTNVAKLSIYGSGSADPLWNARIANPTNPVSGYPPWVETLALDGTNLFIGGTFDAVGGQLRNGLAKVTTLGTGAVETAWNPLPTIQSGYPVARVSALTVGGTNLYVAGAFSSIGGQPRYQLAKLSTATGLADSSWRHDTPLLGLTDNTLQAAGNAGSDLYAGAYFVDTNGVLRSGLVFMPVADAPVIFQNSSPIQSSNLTLVLSRNAADGPEVTHFRVSGIGGGSLYQNDGLTAIHNGDFITVGEGGAGLQFVGTNSTGSITAFSALNNTSAGVGSASTTLSFNVPQPPIFSFSSANYVVDESIPGSVLVLTVVKLRPGTGSVSFALQPGSAVFYDTSMGTGDFTNFTASPLVFNLSDTSKDIRIFINNDSLVEGDETFAVTLTGATEGGIIAYPGTATVTIKDDDCPGPQGSFTNTVLPSPTPVATGGLQVNVQGAAAGQWRLAGDPYWRDSGATAVGLAAGGFYEVDFKPVHGYWEPGNSTVQIAAGITNTISASYNPNTDSPLYGSLQVLISPDTVATNASPSMRGRWFLPDRTLHNSGDIVSNLPAGAYTVQFSDVTNQVAPPSVIVIVGRNQTIYPAAYQPASGTGPATPQPLPFTAVTNPPYFYDGLVETELGFGSGVVVKERVVLTAAHVLFNDATLTYVPPAKTKWCLQKHRGSYEPVGQTPRGWYILDGYAVQRSSNDVSFGISTPESQRLDAAAMYFVPADPSNIDPNELPGRGGYGGFLASDVTPNPWLMSTNLKMLVGYPLEGLPATNWGKMHATTPANLTFSNSYGSVYSTTDIKSYPGNSGGPLYVQTNGQYYPAGIYLGTGSGLETLVRAIDKDVVCLINLAEITANGGGNFTGGGVVFWSGQNINPFSESKITIEIRPAQAVSGALWRINRGPNDFSAWFKNGDTIVTKEGLGTYPVEFNSITGFITPANKFLDVLSANVEYKDYGDYCPIITLSNAARLPNGSFRFTVNAAPGIAYQLQTTTNLAASAIWSPLATLSNITGALPFTNSTATNFSRRFYRAQCVN